MPQTVISLAEGPGGNTTLTMNSFASSDGLDCLGWPSDGLWPIRSPRLRAHRLDLCTHLTLGSRFVIKMYMGFVMLTD